MRLLMKLLPDSTVEKKYIQAGRDFGDMISYSFMGDDLNERWLLQKWARWEKEYARRGFRTIGIDAFIDVGGYGKLLPNITGQKCEEGEEPVLHAQIYRKGFSGKNKSRIILSRLVGYVLPSTEELLYIINKIIITHLLGHMENQVYMCTVHKPISRLSSLRIYVSTQARVYYASYNMRTQPPS